MEIGVLLQTARSKERKNGQNSNFYFTRSSIYRGSAQWSIFLLPDGCIRQIS